MTAEPNRAEVEREAMLLAVDQIIAEVEETTDAKIAALTETVEQLQHRLGLLEKRAPEQDNRHAA